MEPTTFSGMPKGFSGNGRQSPSDWNAALPMRRAIALMHAGLNSALLLLAPLVLALEPAPVSPAIVVSQDGSGAYTEIQRAIDNAKPGDTIFIKAGSYREDVVVHSKNRLRLVGEAQDRVTIHGLKRVGALRVGKWPYGAND